MRVLVTGSTGHIGRAVVPALEAGGYGTKTFDRSARPRDCPGEHFPGDLRDADDVRRAVDGVDAVVHLGAIANDRHGSADLVYATNVLGTLNVLQASAEAGIGRVVYMSSVNALGNFGGHRAAAYLPIDDAYPRHPMTPYQLSKHLAEEACRAYSDRYDMATICLRPVFVAQPDHYGWWTRPMAGRRAEWGRGDYWSYVDMRDVVDAVLRSLAAADVRHDAFLLCAADTTSQTPTAELVQANYPETPWRGVDRDDYLAGRPFRSLLDCSHARERIGWVPRHSWRDAAEVSAGEGTGPRPGAA